MHLSGAGSRPSEREEKREAPLRPLAERGLTKLPHSLTMAGPDRVKLPGRKPEQNKDLAGPPMQNPKKVENRQCQQDPTPNAPHYSRRACSRNELQALSGTASPVEKISKKARQENQC